MNNQTQRAYLHNFFSLSLHQMLKMNFQGFCIIKDLSPFQQTQQVNYEPKQKSPYYMF